jgi:hypothetical protein
MVRLRLITAMIAVGLALGAWPALALARGSQSTNWAGYAVHRPGQSFRQVVGVWTEPSAVCRRGRETFSSYWVGLGGYRAHSPALEQTGTEVDCTSQGHVRAFAWFELVPAAAVRVHLQVPPGDLIRGAVAVTGHSVRITLQDLTQHTEFSKVLPARYVDLSSAEWIVEAPSECWSFGQCMTLPLANFGSMAFQDATVQPTSGPWGSISDSRWRTTRIILIPHNQSLILAHPGLGSGGAASPSGLQSGGSAFTVSYAPMGQSAGAGGQRGLVDAGRLVRPGG